MPLRPAPPLPPPMIRASNVPPVLVAPSVYLPMPQPPQHPKPRRRRGIWIAAGTAVALLAIGGSIGGVAWYRHSQTEAQLAQIRQTVTDFAAASDSADTPKMATLMCAAEAAEFTDGADGDPNAEPITPGTRAAVEIGAISLVENTATVDVTRPPMPAVTLTLTREGDTWKLCNPAGD
ncbi:hypothetical protein A5727_23235 [Mycobacterium sp. ACS4331]|nr:hypothetical protein A5727_23235 [Mycobacterium sp. ACS4331]